MKQINYMFIYIFLSQGKLSESQSDVDEHQTFIDQCLSVNTTLRQNKDKLSRYTDSSTEQAELAEKLQHIQVR